MPDFAIRPRMEGKRVIDFDVVCAACGGVLCGHDDFAFTGPSGRSPAHADDGGAGQMGQPPHDSGDSHAGQ